MKNNLYVSISQSPFFHMGLDMDVFVAISLFPMSSFYLDHSKNYKFSSIK